MSDKDNKKLLSLAKKAYYEQRNTSYDYDDYPRRRIYQQAFDVDPTNLFVLMGLGELEYDFHRYANAVVFFKLATMSHPTNPDTFYNLAIAYEHLVDYDIALRQLFHTLKISSNKDTTYYNAIYTIANIYTKQRKYVEALQYWMTYLKDVPQDDKWRSAAQRSYDECVKKTMLCK